MKFCPLQKAFFNANDGAYSIVTSDERNKGQITITDTDGESEIVIDHFGLSGIPRTGSKGSPLPVIVRDKNGKENVAHLTINFPKKKGTELRIYRKSVSGFAYDTGDVWYVFRRDKELVVGFTSLVDWRSIGTTDMEDSEFQSSVDIGGNEIQYTSFAGTKIKRDPKLAKLAIENSDYKCAYSDQPTPFISRHSGKPYLEAHHLIPLGLQSQFSDSLDNIENIVALNPLWHRAIHHAEAAMVESILKKIASNKMEILKRFGVDEKELIRLYGCEIRVGELRRSP